MEIVLPGTMTVMESHDIALALQHKIESLDEVERAFVHVSYLSYYGCAHVLPDVFNTGCFNDADLCVCFCRDRVRVPG